MRGIRVTLTSNDKTIDYSIDLNSGKFETSVNDESDASQTTTQSGVLGKSDQERQDVALRLYHVILAAMRVSNNGES